MTGPGGSRAPLFVDLNDALADGVLREIDARVHVELRHHVCAVGHRRLEADDQILGDFAARLPLSQEFEDLLLAA